MTLDRREMLRLGAMGAAGAILSTAAGSDRAAAGSRPAGTGSAGAASGCAATRAGPVRAGAKRAGGYRSAAVRARQGRAQFSTESAPRDSIGIADFSQPSSEPRFHVVDLANGTAQSHLVCHGRGSDPDHSGYVERFSQRFGSYATSNGTYVTPIITTASTALAEGPRPRLEQ